MIASSSLQLDLEKALAALLTAKAIMPANWEIFCAHRVDKQAPETASFLSIIADVPDWAAADGQAAEIKVTFQLGTDIAEPDTRVAQGVIHQTLMGDIIDSFARANFDGTLAALNTPPIVPGLGFDGWEGPLPDSQDGRTPDEKKFAPTLNYIFEVFLFAF